MSTPYVGEIRMVGFNFNPQNWHICDGTLIAISENETLYTLLGTTYGGDGQNTFALPDLRGRAPIHQGQGSGLSYYVMGETGGVTSVTLTAAQMAPHTHLVAANGSPGTATSPTGNYFAETANPVYTSGGSPVAMGTLVSATGSNQPHDNQQPYLTVNYIISLFGIYPSQN